MKRITLIFFLIMTTYSLFSQNSVNTERSDNFQVVPVIPEFDINAYKIPDFFFAGAYFGIGFSDFQENILGRQDFSLQAGIRFMYFFNRTSRSGIIFDINYERRGGSTGRVSQMGETFRANMLTFDLMVGGMVSDFYFGAGGFISKKLSEHTTFPSSSVLSRSFDAGFVVTTGLMIESTNQTSILVGFDLRIALLPIAELKGERSKNFSFNFHVGFGFSNQRALNHLRETNKIKIREAGYAYKQRSASFISNVDSQLTFKSTHGVPSFVYQGVEFSLKEMKSVFALSTSLLGSYLNSLHYYQKAMDWLYVALPTGFFSLIAYRINMNMANHLAELAFSELYNQLNSQTEDKHKLLAEILLLTAKKKKQLEQEILSGFSFIGIRFSLGTNVIDRFSDHGYYNHHYYYSKSTFQAGLRYARLFSPGSHTHLRLGFIADAYTEIVSPNHKNIEYMGANIMLAMKYQFFYVGMGVSAQFRLRNPNEDETATIFKKNYIRMIIEPGIIFGKDLKVMAGLSLVFHVKKIQFYYSDYYNTGFYKSRPFAVSFNVSFGI